MYTKFRSKFAFCFYCILLFSFSCNNKNKHYYYYDTGELHYADSLITIEGEDSIFYVKEYHKNGVVKAEGVVRGDSIVEGHWRYYYSDGVLQWEGEVKNSVIQGDYKWNWEKYAENYYQGIEVEGGPLDFIPGRTYKFRVVMPEVHPGFYVVINEKYEKLDNMENPDLYPYIFTPEDSGEYRFRIIFMNEDGVFSSQNPRLDCSIFIEGNVSD